MYAVIRTGGKQYRVAPEDIIEVEKLDAEEGEIYQFADVLMLGNEGEAEVEIGSPLIAGASVAAEILEQGRGKKIIVFKKKRRQNYRRKRGHRQDLTTIRILEILSDGKKPKAKSAAKSGDKAAARAKAKAETAADEPAAKPAKKAKPAAAEVAPAKQPKVDKPADAKPAAAKSAAAKPKGSTRELFRRLDAPEGPADDLRELTGVGPKLAEKLGNYGIYHFWQIAAMTPEDLGAMDAELDLKGRAERDGWIEEAAALAKSSAGAAEPKSAEKSSSKPAKAAAATSGKAKAGK
jgi:large subunit ribosomal protein L21